MNEGKRNFATLTLPGFECRCDGVTLEARAGDGPWYSVVMPSQEPLPESSPDGSADGE